MKHWWKRHPGRGALRTFLDGEHPAAQQNAILLHVEACPECQAELATLRRLAGTAAGAIAPLHAAVDRAPLPPTLRKEGFPMTLPLWRRLLPPTATAAALLLLVSAVAVPPVRALAAQWLSVFRTEKIATVQVTEAQLRDAQRSAARLTPDLARQLAEVNGPKDLPAPVPVSLDEAIALAGGLHQPHLTADLSAGTPEVWGLKPQAYTVKPDVDKINAWLSSQSIPARLSSQLKGQTVQVTTPALAVRKWQAGGGQTLILAEGTGLQVSGSAPLDLQQIVDVLGAMVGVPSDVTAQLKRIPDLQSTLVLPVTPTTGQTVSINDVPGIYYSLPGGGAMVWSSDGKVFAALGTFSQQELQQIVTW